MSRFVVYSKDGQPRKLRSLGVDLWLESGATIRESTAIAARVIRTSAQTIPNNTWTAVSFSQATFDDRPSELSTHWSSGTPTRLTCRVAGTYYVYGSVMFTANTNGDRMIGIRLNGSQFWFTSNTRAVTVATLNTILDVSGIIKLNIEDYIELMAFQNSGGGLNIPYDANNPHSPALGMARIA
jgi:hypothetical protein